MGIFASVACGGLSMVEVAELLGVPATFADGRIESRFGESTYVGISPGEGGPWRIGYDTFGVDEDVSVYLKYGADRVADTALFDQSLGALTREADSLIVTHLDRVLMVKALGELWIDSSLTRSAPFDRGDRISTIVDAPFHRLDLAGLSDARSDVLVYSKGRFVPAAGATVVEGASIVDNAALNAALHRAGVSQPHADADLTNELVKATTDRGGRLHLVVQSGWVLREADPAGYFGAVDAMVAATQQAQTHGADLNIEIVIREID